MQKKAPAITTTPTVTTVDPTKYSTIIRYIHTSSVQHYTADRQPNKILQTQPPEISSSEAQLPRPFRSTLAKLRSGQCSKLNFYRHAIGFSDTDSCPECLSEIHTTSHLFCCAASPTLLTVRDLWTDPVAVARHLVTLVAFSALPTSESPDLGPPTEPPPRAQQYRLVPSG